MNIQENYLLSKLTSLHVGGPADFYTKVSDLESLNAALEFAQKKNLPVLILGGGSNVLVADAGFRGLVIEIDFHGIQITHEDKETMDLKVAAGEVWDDVVIFAVEKGLWGLENLSGIPGKTGAIPIQNVGAYGQEASKVITSLEVLDVASKEIKTLSKEESGFAYRKSKFNSDWRGKFVILNVNFRLQKTPNPNLTYVDVKKYFEGLGLPNPSLMQIRQAILEIRSKKFPKIFEMGSDGSFFKNLILNAQQVEDLDKHIKQNFPTKIYDRYSEVKNKFPTEAGVKIPTAFLIDICGLKGETVGGARLWEKQPLVIVNAGSAKASDVLELFNRVKDVVYEKTGMTLVNEPEFIGF